MSLPHTQVVFADQDGSEFAVSVFGALSHNEALAAGEKYLREFIEMGAWRPTGEPVYRRMQEGS